MAGDQVLAGSVVVVTGATSGIGLAIAGEMLQAGASVVLHGRQEGKAGQALRSLGAADGRATTVLADLADPESHAGLVQRAWEWRGCVDVWVNNAGTDVLTGAVAEASFADKLDALWRVDVRATIVLSRLIGERMWQRADLRRDALILNIGWDQAHWGMEGDSGQMFGATKGAVMAFSRSLAKSLAPRVRVNCLAPGWIQTSWGQQASAAWRRRAEQESLLKRWGAPHDVACAARFLASPEAAFINGQILEVNGGFDASTLSSRPQAFQRDQHGC